MGSPATEEARHVDEGPHRRLIGRSFAIASKPVTVAQWQRFLADCPGIRPGIKRRGGDHAMGRKLYSCFLAAGIPDPEVAAVQSVRTQGKAKALAWSTLDATADAIVSEHLASADEVTAALDDLQRFTADPRTLMCGPRVFQLWSRR